MPASTDLYCGCYFQIQTRKKMYNCSFVSFDTFESFEHSMIGIFLKTLSKTFPGMNLMWTVRILKEKFRHVNFLKYGSGLSEWEIPNMFALKKVSLFLLCDESYLEDVVLPLTLQVFVSKFMAGSLSFDKRVFPWGYAEGEKYLFLKGGNGISLTSPVILWTNTSCCCSQGQLLKCCQKPFCLFVCLF